VGVELDEPFGKNNGDYEGKIYFKIDKKPEKGQLFGVFVKPTSLKPILEPKKSGTGTVTRPSKAPLVPPPSQGKNKLSN
jgi:dynactin complex subunit